MGEMGSCKRILIIKPSSLGDIVHCFPLVDEIRRSCPGSEVDWVANTEYVSLVKRYPGVRNVLAFPRSRWGKATFFHDLRFFCPIFGQKVMMPSLMPRDSCVQP